MTSAATPMVRLTLLGVGARHSPRFVPARLLVRCGVGGIAAASTSRYPEENHCRSDAEAWNGSARD